MFPAFKVRLSGLDSNRLYTVKLDFLQPDSRKYRYIYHRWVFLNERVFVRCHVVVVVVVCLFLSMKKKRVSELFIIRHCPPMCSNVPHFSRFLIPVRSGWCPVQGTAYRKRPAMSLKRDQSMERIFAIKLSPSKD